MPAALTRRATSDAPERSIYRLWRLRKLHQQVDAKLNETDDGVELSLRYNGVVVFRQVWTRRRAAVAAAQHRRALLERQGWIAHW